MEHFIFNCSFCGHSKEDVATLIVGPNVSICSECVQVCVDILRDNIIAAQVEKELSEIYQWEQGYCRKG